MRLLLFLLYCLEINILRVYLFHCCFALVWYWRKINFSGSWFSPMHLTHVLMALVSIYLIYFVWKVNNGKKRAFYIGFGIGIFLLFFLLFMMGWYYSTHPEAYKILLDVGWQGPEFRWMYQRWKWLKFRRGSELCGTSCLASIRSVI